MSKSVLIIDTPESCSECMFRELSHCIVTGEMIETDWCPLSPLPPHNDLTQYVRRGDTQSMLHMVQYMYDSGWNAFRDELLKGKNNEQTN